MSRPQVNSSSRPASIPSAAPDPALKAFMISFLAKISSASSAPRNGMNKRPVMGEKRRLPATAPMMAPQMPAAVLPNFLAPMPPESLSMTMPPATSSARTVHSHHARFSLPMTPCQTHPAAMIIMPGSMGMSVPISPMPNNSRVTHQTRVSERRWGMLSFLSGSRTGGKVSARLADDEERKKGGEIIIAVAAGVVWNGAYDFHRCLSMRLHHVLLRFFSGGHVFSASRFRSGFLRRTRTGPFPEGPCGHGCGNAGYGGNRHGGG